MQNKEDTKKAQEYEDAPCANDIEIILPTRIMVRNATIIQSSNGNEFDNNVYDDIFNSTFNWKIEKCGIT